MDVQKQTSGSQTRDSRYGVDVERARIEHVIAALELLRDGGTRRRGRPPKWLVAARGRLGDESPGAPPEDR
jgi:hypothetical protein